MFDIPPKEEKDSELMAFYREIWNERPHESEISEKPLAYNFGPNMCFVFSHLHTKAACPGLILDKRNVVLMTSKEHFDWEFCSRGELGPRWKWVLDRFETLTPECNV